MNEIYHLCDIPPGQRARVRRLEASGSMRRRLLDIGLTENATVECVSRSPFNDPSAYLISGAVIALRREDCLGILVERC